MTTIFIDVSQHDRGRHGGPLDWNAIRNAGYGTVMSARASYGDPAIFSPASPYFNETMANAKAAGYTCRGAYHNLIKGDQASVNRQVDLLRSTMDKYGGEWAMADVEAYEELKTNGLVPDWGTIQRFNDRWYQVESRVMAWYIARWFWRDYLKSPNLIGLRGPLINADYPGFTGAPANAYPQAKNTGRGFVSMGGRMPDIWQFGSTFTVPGASSLTDANAFEGTVSQLVKLLTGKTTGGNGMALTPEQEVMLRAQTSNAEHYLQSIFGLTENADYISDTVNWNNKVPNKLTPLLKEIAATLALVASKVDIDSTELEAIKQASTAGVLDALPKVVDAILAKMPANVMTREDVESAVRDAFAGGLAPDTDAPAA